MQTIPVTAVPSQSFAVTLANQACAISLTTRNGKLYFSLSVGGVPIATMRVCRNSQRILLDSQYQGFVGDFTFIDTKGDTDPTYTGLGSRYKLIYLEAADL
jgi:hypothetical protein